MWQPQRKYYITESLKNTTTLNTNLHQMWKWKKITEETCNTENRTYAEVNRAGRSPTRRLSKTNNGDINKTFMKNYG